MYDSMCTDTDRATDPDTETIILIGPCGDTAYRIGGVKGLACLPFASLLVPFSAILSCRRKSRCGPALP